MTNIKILITIKGQPRGQPKDNQRTTKGQPKDTDNNDNNDNRIYISAFHEQFWPAYPKKRDKDKALRVWLKLKPDTSLIEEIISFIEKAEQSEDWTKDRGQYIPYPTTFLNGRRWEDELIFKKDWRNDD